MVSSNLIKAPSVSIAFYQNQVDISFCVNDYLPLLSLYGPLLKSLVLPCLRTPWTIGSQFKSNSLSHVIEWDIGYGWAQVEYSYEYDQMDLESEPESAYL